MRRERDTRGRFVASEQIRAPVAHEPDDGPSRSQRRGVQERRLNRPDIWTETKRDRFLAVLAATCNVSEACRAVSMSITGAYKLRDRDLAFRRAWRNAISEGYARLEVQMLERALIAEDRVRHALDAAESDAQALALLARYPSRTAELLYRTHRQTALEAEAADQDDPDGEEALAAIKERVERLRERIVRAADPA